MVDELKSVRDHAIEFIGIFYNAKFELVSDTDFVSLLTKDYSFSGGHIVNSKASASLKNSTGLPKKRVVTVFGGYRIQIQGRGVHGRCVLKDEHQQELLHESTRKDHQISWKVPVERTYTTTTWRRR